MKHLKLIYLFIILGFIGCSKEELEIPDWDCYPYDVFIEIRDIDGNNLFSEDYHGILSLDNITPNITYTHNGVTQPIRLVKNYSDMLYLSRDYRASFFGLAVSDVLFSYFDNKYPRIYFGELDGTLEHNETLILHWPDGTDSKIELTARAVKFNGPSHLMKIRIDDGEWVEYKKTVLINFIK